MSVGCAGADDAGSVWEIDTLNGIVSAGSKGSRPFSSPLQLLVHNDVAPASQLHHCSVHRVSDTFIATTLQELDAWSHGTPLPDLRIPIPAATSGTSSSATVGVSFNAALVAAGASSSAAPNVGLTKRRRTASEESETEEEEERGTGTAGMSKSEYEELAELGLALTPSLKKLCQAGKKF